jgi:hypothetical protein
VSQGTAAATLTGTSPNQVLNLVLQKGDAGAAIELQASSTHLQWRYVGGSSWTNLVALSAITGPTGSTGAAGTAVELQASSTHIQWRYVGGSTWTNVIALSSLVGATGATGAQGPQGPAGTVNLADETPQPLGVASAGTALSAARADHTHSQGSIAYSGLTGIPSTFTPSAHSHAVADVTGLQTALDGKQAAGTYATLVSGTVPSSQLPSYIDDVIEYANLAAFTEQSTGKIYVARDTGKIYRWSGSAYVEISPSPGSTDSVTEGSTNLYYTNTRAAAAAPVQSVSGRTGTITLTKSDVGLGNVPNTDATARANHTGTQLASTISDFATEAAKYGPVVSVSGRTGTVTLTKSDVGLGNVDNTADTAKPISTAVQTALDGKAATSHTHSLANLTQSSATTGQVPTWNGSAWAAATPSGGGGSYTLPTATSSVLGGIKVGANLTITDGVLAATGGGGSANIVEATTAAGFPATGSAQTLYHATDAKRIYFWDSSGVYVEAGTSGGGGSGPSWSSVPASATATGTAGSIAYDGTNLYVATATNSWRLAALQSWAPFTPASLTGVQLWLDAQDAATLFDSTSGGSAVSLGGNVARWSDKSGNDRNATQSSSGARPVYQASVINGYPAIQFNGTSHVMGGSDFLSSSTQSFMMCGVFSNAPVLRGLDGAGGGWSVRASPNSFSVVLSSPTESASNSPTVSGATGNAVSAFVFRHGQSIGLSHNGAYVESSLTKTNLRSSNIPGFWLGSSYNSGSFVSGWYGEIVAVTGDTTTATRQMLEGYLAWKWGLSSSLPANHPYKSNAPNITI